MTISEVRPLHRLLGAVAVLMLLALSGCVVDAGYPGYGSYYTGYGGYAGYGGPAYYYYAPIPPLYFGWGHDLGHGHGGGRGGGRGGRR